MRYPQGGGMSDAERQRRHAIRLRAANLFEHRTPTAEIAAERHPCRGIR